MSTQAPIRLSEKLVGRVLLLLASSSIAALAMIGIFIVREGANSCPATGTPPAVTSGSR